MKIAFQHLTGVDWQGGHSFVKDSICALRSLGAEAPQLSLIVDKRAAPASYAALQPYVDEIIPMSPPSPPVPPPTSFRQRVRRWVKNRVVSLQPNNGKLPPDYDGYGNAFDCSFYVGSGLTVPVPAPRVTWIFDFQHVHLPQYFSPKDRASRDHGFRLHSEAATLVFVTAEDVRRDFLQFAPDLGGKVRVVRLVPDIPRVVYDLSPGDLVHTYHLPRKFILVPNQFWTHKNHKLILEALHLLKEKEVEPVVVCAGSIFDPRAPQFFGEFLQQASRWGVRDQFIALNTLPREEVLTLMRQSIGVLNASLFEGFGYTAAESISFGKPALLSDLPVHHEHNHPEAAFFDPFDARDLANKMEVLWATGKPGPNMSLEAERHEQLLTRQREFGRALLQLAQEAKTLQHAVV